MNQLNRRRGFTLVELLVVISIIGILAMVTVGSFMESQKKSRDASRKANLKSLAEAVFLYYADTGFFPTEINFGGELAIGSGDNKVIYMKKTPSGTTLSGILGVGYTTSSTYKSFRLITNLENEEDKDCISRTVCRDVLDYQINSGCCYAITSSNVGTIDNVGSFP